MINDCPFMQQLTMCLREEERIFKLKSVEEISRNNFRIEFLVNALVYDGYLNDRLREKVTETVKFILPKSVNSKVIFTKTITEDKYVIKSIMDYILREYPTIYNSMRDADIKVVIENELITVQLTLQKFLFQFFNESGIAEKLEEDIDENFWESGEIIVLEVPNKENALTVKRSNSVSVNSIRIIDVSISRIYFGTVANTPRYILDVCDKECNQLTVCGILSNITSREIPTYGSTLYTAILNDTTGNIPIKMFTKPPKILKDETKNFEWKDVFCDGTTVIVNGQLQFDKYSNKLVLNAKGIATCGINFNSINVKSDYHTEVADEYIKVKPQPYEEVKQVNLFVKDTVNNDLKNNVYVVFDTETTGLDPTKNRIIEFAGVKIVGGVIVETFSTLINPEILLPEEIIEITGITDEMLEGQPVFSEVVSDIYKFTRGAILVAHNATFDMSFLGMESKKCKYEFDNLFMDTLAMAKQQLTNIKKYNLGCVCNSLNISLEGAHRAINDAIATAKVFVELMNKRSKID